ncbi:hypothetical protein CEP54_005590 [Fusarium duplospermum]|uniref:Uncharacterized protein n=1 Tax=Fusarium duplospermum TaxID=1325734 RepID=A0A428QBQ3_9HYPO|nr:hypothetical protein CEP54_005590 [Fusarium duplospermum]
MSSLRSFIPRPYPPLPDTPRTADKSIIDEPPIYYASKRCRLCQFSLRGGDFVVTRTVNNVANISDTNLILCAEIAHERFSPEFALRTNFRSTNAVRLFHSFCVKFKHFIITDDFLAVTEHSIGLSELEERQRLKRIQHLLAPKISNLLSAKLPFEVMTMISSYLVRESAMITAKHQSMFSQSSDITVDLSKDVYASYSVLDGVRYVKSLRNLDTDQRGEYRRVLNAKEKSTIGKIRICEDHLGIRFVQFLPPNGSSSKVPVVKGWWRDISPSRGSGDTSQVKFSTIRVESDGIKLRRITDTFDEYAKLKNPHVTWPSPDYPSNKIDLISDNYIVQHFTVSRNVRMTYFDCNAPGVTGYTMVSQGHWVSTIHAHGKGDDSDFYKELDACFGDQVVVYMPVDQGEYITDIQRRWMGRLRGSFFDLTFKTNRGRQTIFGSENGPLMVLLVDTILRPSQQGSRIYFNKVGPENETSVRFIACDEPFKPPIQRWLPPRPAPTITDPPFLNLDKNPWFASRCNLEGVKEVTLCRDVSLSHRPVIGILVQYTDGHRECLGQFRFDRSLETIQADQSGGLHIDLQEIEDEDSMYVVDVRGFPLGDPSVCPGNESWVEAPWSGTLEWKFRREDCKVLHIPVVE